MRPFLIQVDWYPSTKRTFSHTREHKGCTSTWDDHLKTQGGGHLQRGSGETVPSWVLGPFNQEIDKRPDKTFTQDFIGGCSTKVQKQVTSALLAPRVGTSWFFACGNNRSGLQVGQEEWLRWSAQPLVVLCAGTLGSTCSHFQHLRSSSWFVAF